MYGLTMQFDKLLLFALLAGSTVVTSAGLFMCISVRPPLPEGSQATRPFPVVNHFALHFSMGAQPLKGPFGWLLCAPS